MGEFDFFNCAPDAPLPTSTCDNKGAHDSDKIWCQPKISQNLHAKLANGAIPKTYDEWHVKIANLIASFTLDKMRATINSENRIDVEQTLSLDANPDCFGCLDAVYKNSNVPSTQNYKPQDHGMSNCIVQNGCLLNCKCNDKKGKPIDDVECVKKWKKLACFYQQSPCASRCIFEPCINMDLEFFYSNDTSFNIGDDDLASIAQNVVNFLNNNAKDLFDEQVRQANENYIRNIVLSLKVKEIMSSSQMASVRQSCTIGGDPTTGEGKPFFRVKMSLVADVLQLAVKNATTKSGDNAVSVMLNENIENSVQFLTRVKTIANSYWQKTKYYVYATLGIVGTMLFVCLVLYAIRFFNK